MWLDNTAQPSPEVDGATDNTANTVQFMGRLLLCRLSK